jgi:hypothetical protein
MDQILRVFKFLQQLALGASFLIISATAQADDWRSQSNYPARISAFAFDTGSLDSSHSIRIGSWTISFAQGPPIVVSLPQYKYYVTQFPPWQLICSNSISGQIGCALELSYDNPEHCTIVSNDFQFPVPCPTSVSFQQ